MAKQIKKYKGLSESQIESLVDAWNYCDEEDKSTEFMLQYMSDVAGIDYDIVVEFVTNYER
jgi:hypothetical protein